MKLKRLKLRCLAILLVVLSPALNVIYAQHTITICQTQTDALIATDRNDWSHANLPVVNEGYLHNFSAPPLPCGLTNPSLTTVNATIDLLTVTTSMDCTGIPFFGNVLLNCPLTNTAVCPIVQDVLSVACGFGTGQQNPGSYTLDLSTCGVNPTITDVIGIDIIPATDFSMACPSNGSAITNGEVDITYQICLEYVYNQPSPVDCANTITQNCNDGDPCTENDTQIVDACDNTIICQACTGTPIASCANTILTACDDGDPCTINDMQSVDACDNFTTCGPCMGTPAPICNSTVILPCDDGDPCTENDTETVDACDNFTICQPCAGTPVPTCSNPIIVPCDDGDDCTINDMQTIDACNSFTVCAPCAGTPVPVCDNPIIVPCNDGDPCTENDVQTVDACNNTICAPCAGTPVAACSSTSVVACNDGDPCTENDTQTIDDCNGAICVPCAGTPVPVCTNTSVVACNDGDPCTENDMQTIDDCGTMVLLILQ